jgi:hypothetical protein
MMAAALESRRALTATLADSPYDLLAYLERAGMHAALGYPDLAAGDAYRVMLLADEALFSDYEYNEQVLDAFVGRVADCAPRELPPALEGRVDASHVDWNAVREWAADGVSAVRGHSNVLAVAVVHALQILAGELEKCGCLASASRFCAQGLVLAPTDPVLAAADAAIRAAAEKRLGSADYDKNDLPDDGLVRRELYPWNDHEPDRFSEETLAHLNARLADMAPKCEVRVATLPVLIEGIKDDTPTTTTCKQLGLFAKADIAPGEVVLDEYSLVTASNRLKDSFCDACSTELPPLSRPAPTPGDAPESCPDCGDAVFCNARCLARAEERYHPAVCDLAGLDAIGRDPPAAEAGDALYLILLARVLAMAAHADTHPLDVPEVRFLWGDFLPGSTLPFSFKYNMERPLHVLETMGVDVYADAARTDLWVLNTLYAKFRGVASARKSARDGRPDVAAVHPFWCLANHDCDPNVRWEWGGRMVLSAREERVDLGDGVRRAGGIKAGDEILNNYCDIDMAVQDRREWARGSLGGFCQCLRCRREAGEV